jgi:hypothetical protein
MARHIKLRYSAKTRQDFLKAMRAVSSDPLPYNGEILRHILQALLYRIKNQKRLGSSDSYHIESLIENIAAEEWRVNNEPSFINGSPKVHNAVKRIKMLIETLATAPSETAKVACIPKIILIQRDEILEYLLKAYPFKDANNSITLIEWLNSRGSVFIHMLQPIRCSCRYPRVFPSLKLSDMKRLKDWHNVGPVTDLILSRFHGCNSSYISKLIKRGEQHREKGIHDLQKLTYS